MQLAETGEGLVRWAQHHLPLVWRINSFTPPRLSVCPPHEHETRAAYTGDVLERALARERVD